MREGPDEGRRAFLRGVLRIAIAGGAVAGVGALATKKGQTCTNQGICRGCATFEACELPQALSAKEAQRHG